VQAKDQQLQIRVTAAEKTAIQRAATRAGLDVSRWVLNRLLPPHCRRFQELTAALEASHADRRYVLAELNDFVTALGAREFLAATGEAPPLALEPYVANYAAAMVETAANKKGVAAPAWAARIAPLAEPVFGADLASLRLHLLTASPPAFRRRRIFIDATVGDRV